MDGFQGREVDVVLFSCVRATPVGGGGGRKTIGFLSDRRRMNVAITRAKRSLVILGNVKRLASDRTWRALVEHANSQGKLVPGGDSSAGKTPSGEALCNRLEAMCKAHLEAVAAARGDRGRTRESQHEKKREGKERRGERSPGEGEPRRKKIISASQQDARDSAPTPREDSENSRCDVQVEKGTRDSTSVKTLSRGGKDGSEGKTRKAMDGVRIDKSDTRLGFSESSSRLVSPGEVAGDQLAHAPHEDRKASSGSRRGQDVNNDRSGGTERSKKRTRKDRGSDDRTSDKNASTGGGDGFNLGGLLGSMDSTAKKIASGKDHEFRRGLQGGAVSEYSSVLHEDILTLHASQYEARERAYSFLKRLNPMLEPRVWHLVSFFSRVDFTCFMFVP